ncbi:hypothetical protein [Geothrix paludis]|uniref:hypothetical protein n=1 Tax=Geothrix paludis TaxID=2922722 RepID=UPI001FAE243C|nr:hypothetical protein [Geothrix paludis]
MNKGTSYFFILLSLGFQILSAVFGKRAAMVMTPFTVDRLSHNHYYLASLGCLALQALFWPLALRRVPLFKAYLFMSGIYLAIPLISRFVFNEHLTSFNLAGSLLIAGGIGCLMYPGKAARHA